MATPSRPLGKQALRAFMGLPAVSMPPKDKKADFDRLRAWAEKQPNPASLTVEDFIMYNNGPYMTPAFGGGPMDSSALMDEDDLPLALTAPPAKKKAKIEGLPAGMGINSGEGDAAAKAVIKKAMAFLEPVSTYKPHALPVDDLVKAATVMVEAATELENTYKTAGAKALAEAINKNLALSAALDEIEVAPPP